MSSSQILTLLPTCMATEEAEVIQHRTIALDALLEPERHGDRAVASVGVGIVGQRSKQKEHGLHARRTEAALRLSPRTVECFRAALAVRAHPAML